MNQYVLLLIGVAGIFAIPFPDRFNPDRLCGELLALNCKDLTADTDETVCATNGQIYPNFCTFDQARCKDHTIDIDPSFGCITTHPPDTTTTPTTAHILITEVNTQHEMTTPPTPKQTTIMMTTTPAPTMTTTPAPTTTTTHTTTRMTTSQTTRMTTAPTTTIKTTTPMPTRDQMQQLFCDNRDLVTCAYDPNKVCGTDNVTYENNCEYAKKQCDNIYLQIQHAGECKH